MSFVAHWEYDWTRCGAQAEDDVVRDRLAARGKDGWELVAVVDDRYGTNFYFKRRTYAPLDQGGVTTGDENGDER